MNTLKHITIIAILYALFGRLALMMALPPGYASPIWPAAGIALAFMLRFGFRIWPGIIIGSFCVNIWTSFDTSSTQAIIKSIVLAFSIGAGAGLQAVAGCFLVKHFVHGPLQLINVREIGKVLFWGGIIGCMVSPTVGVLSLTLNGIIPFAGSYMNWFTWWVGDTIGVFLFLPLTLAWIGEPRQMWIERRLSLTITLLMVSVVILSILIFGKKTDNAKIYQVFENETYTFSNALRYKLSEFYVVLDSVQSFFMSSTYVDRNEFGTFLRGVKQKLPEIKSIAWVPRVLKEEIPRYIDLAAKDGIENYHIKEVGPEGKLQPAGSREVYYPLFYLEPQEGNEVALGIDNGSEPNRLESTLLAMDTGMARASAPIILGQDRRKGVRSLLITIPVYKEDASLDTVENRRNNIEGFITITSRIEDLIKGALKTSAFPDNIVFSVYDMEYMPKDPIYVYAIKKAGSGDKHAQIKKDIIIDVAGRKWKLYFQSTLAFIVNQQTWTLWLILVGTLLLSSLLNILILFITGQTQEVSRMVALRTRELQSSQKKLEEQMALKEKAVSNLAAQADKLQEQQKAMLNILEDAENSRKELEESNTLLTKLTGQMDDMNKDLEEKVLERTEELTETQEKLVRQEKLAGMGKLAGIIGHEMRGPLGVIRNSAYFLKMKLKDIRDDKIFRHLNILDEEVYKANRIIEDTLDFARVKEPNLEVADIDTLIRHALERKEIPKDIKVVHKSGGSLLFVNTDILQMQRVYYNLIWNAIQAMPDGGTLTVTNNKKNECVETSFEDTGSGISEDDLKKIFEPLYTTKIKGTGLGLSVCQSIVQKHGGVLIVESVVGKGTKFIVRLPKAKKEST